jgi:hypothetical protein
LIEIATNQSGQNAIFVNDDNANSGSGSASIFVDKDGNNGSAIYGLYLDVANAGAGPAHALGIGAGSISLADGVNIVAGTSTGTKIGTATSQKLSVWNATPIVQPTTAIAAATFAANTSAIANDTATFDGYTIGQVVKALRNMGALA